MKRIGMAVALAGVVGFAGTAHGQACVGAANLPAEFSAGGEVHFTGDARTYGANFHANFDSPAFARGSFSVTDTGFEGASNMNTFGIFGGWDFAGMAPLGYSMCPTVGAFATSWEGTETLEIPLGFGLGSAFDVGGMRLLPFIHPEFTFARITGEGITDDARSDTFFRLSGGATLDLGRFYVSGLLGRVLEDNVDTSFGIGAGVKF
jgi:hypothetical protein